MAEIDQVIIIAAIKTWRFGKTRGNLENDLLVEFFIWDQPTERGTLVIQSFFSKIVHISVWQVNKWQRMRMCWIDPSHRFPEFPHLQLQLRRQ